MAVIHSEAAASDWVHMQQSPAAAGGENQKELQGY
jgi:hypothetical protein